MCSPFDTIPACDRWTDGPTDGRTDGTAVASTALAMRALRRAVEMMQLLAVYAECFTSYSIHTRSFRRQVYPINCSGTDIQTPNNQEQEGQHPLTGQRAAKFRLLANQWAECRLVTQWGDVCATQVLPMRVGPFAFRYQGNGATPCQYVDTSRKAIDCTTTLPLVFYTMKFCSRLFVLYCRNCPKDDKFKYFCQVLISDWLPEY